MTPPPSPQRSADLVVTFPRRIGEAEPQGFMVFSLGDSRRDGEGEGSGIG